MNVVPVVRRNVRRIDPELPERRGSDGRLEVLGIESADPRWVAASIESLVSTAYRLRALGTIAIQQRKYANNNPNAVFYARPLTWDDYDNARWISKPIRLPSHPRRLCLKDRYAEPWRVMEHSVSKSSRSGVGLRCSGLGIGGSR